MIAFFTIFLLIQLLSALNYIKKMKISLSLNFESNNSSPLKLKYRNNQNIYPELFWKTLYSGQLWQWLSLCLRERSEYINPKSNKLKSEIFDSYMSSYFLA